MKPGLAFLLPVGGLVGLLALAVGGVKPTNIGGYEWPMIHMAAQGIADEPYGNRPLGLLWHLPPALLWPDSFAGYWAAHLFYTCLSGVLLYALCRRLAPERSQLAWLAAAFCLTWAPLDHARLDSIPAIVYSGATFGSLVALGLLVESWLRQRIGLLVAAGVIALVVARASEATLPLFVGAPVLFYCRSPSGAPRRSPWLALWSLVVVLGFGLALASMSNAGGYQEGMGFDPHPLHVLRRLLLQFSFHLGPLVRVLPTTLGAPRVALSAAAFLLFWMTLPRGADRPEPGGLGFGLRAAGLGLFFAALAYGGPAMAAAYVTPERMQILSAPGIGLALAGGVSQLAAFWPWRGRRLLIGGLGAWIVASGTAHTLALQKEWDEAGALPRQSALMARLFEIAPDLEPNTLLILVDPSATFPASFAFRHAVAYCYPGHATGLTGSGADLLYPATFTPTGVRIEPLAVLQRPWNEPPTFHRYEELVVLGYANGKLRMLDQWPTDALPQLPRDARYAPQARIRHDAPGVPARAMLTRP